MTIDVVATSDFIHGKLEMNKRGEASLPEQLAKDLQRAGLVRLANDASENKVAPTVANKVAPPARNKATKSSKGQSGTSDVGAQTGASADVCTDKHGFLGQDAPNDLNELRVPVDAAAIGGGQDSAESVASAGPAAAAPV